MRFRLNTGRSVWNTYAHDTKPKMEQEAAAGHLWAQLMKKAGYRTYMTGKWHVKATPETVFDVVKDERSGMPGDFYKKGSTNGTKPKGYGYNRSVYVQSVSSIPLSAHHSRIILWVAAFS